MLNWWEFWKLHLCVLKCHSPTKTGRKKEEWEENILDNGRNALGNTSRGNWNKVGRKGTPFFWMKGIWISLAYICIGSFDTFLKTYFSNILLWSISIRKVERIVQWTSTFLLRFYNGRFTLCVTCLTLYPSLLMHPSSLFSDAFQRELKDWVHFTPKLFSIYINICYDSF